MECNNCGGTHPLIKEDQQDPTIYCMFCDNGVVLPDATEYLDNTDYSIVNEVRPNQVKLAREIRQCIRDKTPGVFEAGTGLGKSFAYLLPALLAKDNDKIVISTAKKSLQDQLIKKDLPYLQYALPKPSFKFEPVYGKSNYACYEAIKSKVKPPDKTHYLDFLEKSQDGLWAENKNPRVKRRLELSADKCYGSVCQYYRTCKYIEAKKRQKTTDVIVVNHWLLGLEIRHQLREKLSLFGTANTIIVDEAHKLHDGLRDAFTETVHESDLHKAIRAFEKNEPQRFLRHKDKLKTAWNNLFQEAQKYPEGASIAASSCETHSVIATINNEIGDLVQNKKVKTVLAPRAQTLSVTPPSAESQETDEDYRLKRSVQVLIQSFHEIRNTLISMINNGESDNYITFLEKDSDGLKIQQTPVSIAPIMERAHSTFTESTWIFSSATLQVNNSLDDFIQQVGLTPDKVNAKCFDSPFNYDKQAVLYISKNVPIATRNDDKVEEYREKLSQEIKDLIEANQGNAFVLFTARDEMHDVYMRLRDHTHIPIILQEKSAAQALTAYRNTKNSVLFGLKSFWEGVDIQGKDLSLVIITKLPFPNRSDPIVQAQREKAGSKSFMKVDLVGMILDLRQGIGRLIRTQTDKGVVAILDQRLLTKSYKTAVLKSLRLKKITNNKNAILNLLRKTANAPA